jgi:PPM family protein phosphatase
LNRQPITTGCKNDIGRRSANEDSLLVLERDDMGSDFDCLLVVADGMGGRASGAAASRLAIDAVRETIKSASSADAAELLASCLRAANSAVYRESCSRPELQGMGTTCVAALIRDEHLFYAHLGDSRAYLMRGGELRCLTEDHSFVAEKIKSGEMSEEQARRSRFRNIITKAIGIEPQVDPDTGSAGLHPGDIVLVCSDGLTTPVSESEIADILCSSSDVDEACNRLIHAALRNGGSDNITVAIAIYGHNKAIVTSKPRYSKTVFFALIALIVGIGVGLYSEHFLLPKFMAPSKKAVSVVKRPLPVNVGYESPVSLLYMPLQGRMITLDGRGYLYAVTRHGELLRIDSGGQVTYKFQAQENLRLQASRPSAMLASDSEGNLYVSDPVGRCIKKYSAGGIFLCKIADGELSGPEALAVGQNGDIFVIDGNRLKLIRAVSHPGLKDY